MTEQTDKNVISPMGGRFPIKNIEEVDKDQQIWKGEIVDFPDKTIDDPVVYFSRKYDRANSDLDRCLEEVHMPASVNGYDFWLIPKEKMLCGVMPRITPGGVVLPVPKGLRNRFRPQM